MYEVKRLYKMKDAKEAHDFLVKNEVRIWSWGYYKDRIKECQDEKCRQRFIGKLIKKKQEFGYAFKSRRRKSKSRKRAVKKSKSRKRVTKSRRIYDGSDMATSRQILVAVIEEMRKKFPVRYEFKNNNTVYMHIGEDDWVLNIDIGDDDAYKDHKLFAINFQDDDKEFFFETPFKMKNDLYKVDKDIIKIFYVVY